MKNKQLVLKKIEELNNFVNAQRSLMSSNQSREVIFAQLEKLEYKIKEIEVLVNSEYEQY